MDKNSIDAYMQHLPSCNIENTKAWDDAFIALADSPEGPDKEHAYAEMREKMKQCTCGMAAVIVNAHERYFTIDEIEKMRAEAYNEGYCSGYEEAEQTHG